MLHGVRKKSTWTWTWSSGNIEKETRRADKEQHLLSTFNTKPALKYELQMTANKFDLDLGLASWIFHVDRYSLPVATSTFFLCLKSFKYSCVFVQNLPRSFIYNHNTSSPVCTDGRQSRNFMNINEDRLVRVTAAWAGSNRAPNMTDCVGDV